MTAKDMFSHRVSILTGHYGTGKTEVSVNLALALAAEGEQVMLADLDIVNPYFRSRERRPLLEKAGVRVISSSQACSDADVPALPAELLTILEALHRAFPSLQRVTTYAGPRSTLAKTPEELRTLREAGLTRAYLGVETGCDALLKQVKKGVDAAQMLEAGVRLREAGMDLWVMVILGLAGTGEPSRRHMLDTAAMMNEMKPRHLSALTLTLDPGTELYQDYRAGRFHPITPRESLLEAKLLLENLTVDPLHFTCNHASNYLPLKGGLPEDRDRFLAMLDRALAGEQELRPEWSRGF